MNLKYMKVSLFEISYKKKMIFLDAPVYYIILYILNIYC